ncbi:MAG: transposase, partial [Rhodospirillales bacterium]|nr:transposase [Rhodospirillales bacterium]
MTKQEGKGASIAIKALLEDDADFLRSSVKAAIETALEAEMTEVIGAAKGERTDTRLGYRAGYYHRSLITRVGTLELRVPQDRAGRFSTELFERYQRSEKALVSALSEMYVQGVSTRKVKAVTEALCGHAFSASAISEANKSLDAALTGRKSDDSYEADVEFPADFRNESLAGKTAKVSFKIIKVQEPKLPEIDAEFAKLFGIADGDLEHFRKEVRANLERELKAALMGRLKSEVAEKLADAHPALDVPKLMVQSEAQAMAAGSVPRGQQPPPQLVEAAMPMARKRVTAGLLMGEIA